MSNDAAASVSGLAMQPPPPGFASIAWSDGQLKRLREEHQALLRDYAYHPYAAVTAVRGDPPTRYRVDFRVRTLVVNGSEELEFAETASVDIWMSPGFPTQPPLVRPLVGLFHPNVAPEAIALAAWQPTDRISDIIRRVGDYLAWRSYDPAHIVNEVAGQWLTENGASLPLDPTGDFTPNAGGEPLGRINRYGPVTLDQLQKAIDELFRNIEGEQGLTAIQIQSFAQQTLNTVRMFRADDLPALRERAEDFHRTATDLLATAQQWDSLRRAKASARAAMTGATQVTEIAGPLTAELEALGGLVKEKFSKASESVRLLPSMEKLQPVQLKLPELVKEGERRLEALKSRISALSSVLPAEAAHGAASAVSQRVAAHRSAVAEQVQTALRTGNETVSAFGPTLATARAECDALAAIVKWREYMDAFGSAAEVEQRLAKLGADGLGGYFIKNAAGKYGPFQLEQEVDLGTVNVLVRSNEPDELELVNSANDVVMGSSTEGKLTVKLPAGEGEPPAITQFSLAEGMEQPAIQLDYASRQTSQVITQLEAVQARGAVSWCGKMVALFCGTAALAAARTEHRRSVHRWNRLLIDLKRLFEFKSRLATYHLLSHCANLVPRLVAAREAAVGRYEHASRRLSQIAAKGTRHPETDGLIIAPKLAAAYAAEEQAKEAAKRETRRLEAQLGTIAARLKTRLSSPRLCGRPEVPELRIIPPVSEDLAAFAAEMSDDAIKALAENLAAQLKTKLPISLKPAPAPTERLPVVVKPEPAAGDAEGSAEENAASNGTQGEGDEAESELIANDDETRYEHRDLFEEPAAGEVQESEHQPDNAIEMTDEQAT